MPFRVDWRIAAAVAGLIVLALVVDALRSGEPDADAGGAPMAVDGGAGIEPAPAVEPAAAAASSSSGGRELAIPAVSQIGSRGLIYTLMSAQLEPGGSSDTLRLRVALENETDGGANFWDDTFRLVVDGDVLAPNSGLNVFVASHATSEGTVTFSVPRGAGRGILRATLLASAGDIPLDFSGRAVGARPPASRSARAIVTAITNDSRALVTHPELAATLTGVSTRRFANVLRVDLPLRLAALRGGVASNGVTLRLAVGDDVLAPTKFPGVYIEGGTTLRMAAEFEVPPNTTRAVLRAAFGDASNELPLTLR